MSNKPSQTIRALKPNDLARVVEIDSRIGGRARKQFFEKRLEAALADTTGFIAVATESGGILNGYAIARLQEGQFGIERKVAVLDVIGVDPEVQKQGQGSMLMDGIAARARKLGIREIRTQLDWHDKGLIGFFASQDFQLTPNKVLERAVTRNL